MKWNQKGRPRGRNPEGVRKETRIAKDRKDGMKLLACAVLKQWIEDGRPDDLPKEWVAVLKFLMEGKNEL